MKKVIYILTCVNQDNDIVSANTYKEKKFAVYGMEAQYQYEKREAVSAGYDEDELDDDEQNFLWDEKAELHYGSFEFYWKITEEEVTDGYSDEAQKLLDEYNGGACDNRAELLAKAMELIEKIAKYSNRTIHE